MFGRDRRLEKRLDCDIRAAIVGARPKLFSCAIKNVSGRGAKIAISGDWVLPSLFSLVGSKDGQDTLGCRVVWRKGDHVGVRLTQRVD